MPKQTKYAGNVYQIQGKNSPYQSWNNLEVIKSDDGNNAFTDKLTNKYGAFPKPSSIGCDSFGFNIPTNANILSVNIELCIYESSNNPDNQSGMKYPSSIINFTDGKFIKWDSTGKYLHDSNIDSPQLKNWVSTNNLSICSPERLNNNFNIRFDFPKTIYTQSKSQIIIEYVRIIIEYSAEPSYVISSGETSENFPTFDKPRNIFVNSIIEYLVYFKNYGGESTESQKVQLNIPNGVNIVGVNTNGSYDVNKNIWYPNEKGNELTKLSLQLKFPYEGNYILSATHNTSNTWDYNVNVMKNYVPDTYHDEIIIVNSPTLNRNDNEQLLEVCVGGIHNEKTEHSFELTGVEGLNFNTIKIDKNKSSSNVLNIKKGSSENTIIIITDKEDTNKYSAYFNIQYCPPNEGKFTLFIHSIDSNKNYTKNLEVFSAKGVLLDVIGDYSYYNDVSNQTTHIGKPGVITLAAGGDPDYNNFKINKDTMSMTLEKLLAYIGPVRLERAHNDDVKNDTKNTLITDRYHERVNVGKKGDYKEDISMKLRVPWRDIVTLQGLAKMDKPVALDTCPLLPDGDPLNHRGWVELYEVNNIKKINSLLYQCDIETYYLTREINTRFNVNHLNKICNISNPHLLYTSHLFTDKITEIFNVNCSGLFNNLALDNNETKFKAHFALDTKEKANLLTKNKLSRYCGWSIRWLNILSQLGSSAHDNNNWTMTVRILSKEDMQMLFEYLYYDFNHYDDTLNEVLNECRVKATVLDKNGVYRVIAYKDMNLDYDTVLAKPDDTVKVNTIIEGNDEIFTSVNSKFTVTLKDTNGSCLEGKTIHSILNSPYAPNKDYKVVTNDEGKAEIEINLLSGEYYFDCQYEGDEFTNPSSNKFKVTVNILEKVGSNLVYDKNKTYITRGELFKCKLVDPDGDGIGGVPMRFTLVATDGKTSAPYWGNTDGKGYFTYVDSELGLVQGLPIRLINSNYWRMNIVFEGDSRYSGKEETVPFKVNIVDGIPVLLKTENKIIPSDSTGHYFDATLLKATDNSPLANQEIIFRLSAPNNTDTKEYTIKTDVNGIAKLPINLISAIWDIETIYMGKEGYYQANTVFNTVSVQKDGLKNTKFYGENLVITDCNDHIFSLYLKDDGDKAVTNKYITINLENQGNLNVFKEYTIKTDVNGKAELPLGLGTGDWKLYANSEATGSYNGTYATFDVTVQLPSGLIPTTFITDNTVFTTNDGSEKFEVTLLDNKGNPLANKKISMNFVNSNNPQSSETYNRTTDENGKANVPIGWDAGNYQFQCTMKCSGNYASNTTTFNIQVQIDNRKTSSIICSDMTHQVGRDGEYLQATFVDGGGNAIKGAIVTIKIVNALNEVNTYTHITDNMGSISRPNVMSVPGNYSITFGLTGDGNYKDISKTVNLTVVGKTPSVLSAPSTMSTNTKSGDLLKVTLRDNKNNLIKKANVVMSLINANNETVNYVKETNDSGEASLSINLTYANVYSVVSQAKGNNTFEDSNTVTTTVTVTEPVSPPVNPPVNPPVIEKPAEVIPVTKVATKLVYASTQQTVHKGHVVYVQLLDINNKPVTGKTVIMKLINNTYGNYKDYIRTSGDKGYAELELNLNDGDYTVESRFEGDTSYIASSASRRMNLISSSSFALRSMLSRAFTYGVFGVSTTSEITNENYDGTQYGSTLYLGLDGNILKIVDYGLIDEGTLAGGKIILNDIELIDKEYLLEIEINYNSPTGEILDRLHSNLQVQVNEDSLTSGYSQMYNNLIVSPSPVPNRQGEFVRHTNEGILYYYDFNNEPISYIGSPFNQYKCGVNLETENGVSILDTESSLSPIVMNNGLIKVSFHRRSGLIELYRYDEDNNSFIKVRRLKLGEIPFIKLEEYTDDKCILQFGSTFWTMWRGRPFIEVKHENTDLKLLGTVDRAFCEVNKNKQFLELIDETVVDKGEFKTYRTIQKFPANIHVGQDITLDNFRHWSESKDNYISIVMDENQNPGVKLIKYNRSKSKICFPDPYLLEKPAKTFTLLLNKLRCSYPNNTKVTITARGFDYLGRKRSEDDPNGDSYIWSETQELFNLNTSNKLFRKTFTIPSDIFSSVKYIDFVITMEDFNIQGFNSISFRELMLYEGDSEPAYQTNITEYNSDMSRIYFNKNYYANLYNEKDKFGLCVVRPHYDSFTLGIVEKSDVTVFVPYLKDKPKKDRPEFVAMEYMNSYDQEVKIMWM